MKTLSVAFGLLAVLLSDVMCAVVAYSYADMQWGIKYGGYSAPVYAAFALATPYLLAIAVAVTLALAFRKKSMK